jgi:hypothetical protein
MANSLQQYNSFDSDLKAHSSALTNERISALIALFDEAMITANLDLDYENTERALVYLKQIWKSFRPLVRMNAFVRADLKLNTHTDGVYLPDFGFRSIENVILEFKLNMLTETTRVITNLNRELESLEIMIRDVIQYFKFTFRPDSRTKPDIFEATEMMMENIDNRTEEELLEVVGVNNHIKWSEHAKERIFNREKRD